ncbi:cucumisin-like isoform X4 [Malus sylvestris]|uniref:cucumisin-like isoform X4 n=1 Tax=Malus sylvestris TaxID=3752 RepID=UPI0021AC36DA|nr:cucumisin-like isoform X4 [Malus sylvestris]
MALTPWFLLLISLISTLPVDVTLSAAHQDTRKDYIVYMGDKPKPEVSTTTTSALHVNMLQNVIDDSNIAHESLLLHSYKRTFNGFAAKLTEEEAQKLAGMDGVVSVFPSETKKLQTTRSWDFIGFPEMVKRSAIETDIIVGVIDTGIWPESASFSDAGFGPPPKRWKGACKGEGNFTCNNKIIGARYYRSQPYPQNSSDILSPRDTDGHGTHTASTAAGNLVSKASLYGLGLGTARGGVPSARIAVYKVCWSDGCPDADILAAFDDAIADGVDILSVSLGGFKPLDYFRNSIDIGAFHALRKGIFTSASAGNEGPNLKTITNFAPWYLAVAASTIDRHFDTKVQLGNHKIYEGIVTNTFELKGKFYPIVYAADVPDTAAGYDGKTSRLCRIGTLDKKLVEGKIVLCDGPTGYGAIYAGAFGYVLTSRKAADVIDPVPIPAASIWFHLGNEIAHYLNSTRNPTATIWKSTEGMDALAPYVPSFSSRGPNPNTPNILKPDIASPGVSILAAWSPIAPVSGFEGDDRVTSYNIISGTSMACPHAAGVAAYVKSFHPNWSPAAILSALTTTAKPMSANLNPEAEFAYGAGLLNPSRSPYPGLVYDAAEIDYVNFLCAQGYSTKLLKALTGDSYSCSSSQSSHGTLSDHLNYPSVALSTSNPKSVNGIFNRTITNVGSPKSTYKAKVSTPPGLEIKVNPSVLKFASLEQKLSFQVTVKGLIEKTIVSGSLVWDDGKFQVRSPIVVYFVF